MGTFIRRFVEVMIIVMPMIALVFIFILIYVHIAIDIRRYFCRKIKLNLLLFIKVSLFRESQLRELSKNLDPRIQEKLFKRIRFIRNNCGLRIIEELAQTLENEKRDYLHQIVCSKSYSKYLHRKLKGYDLTSILLIIKIIGDLSLPGYGDKIEKILYKYSKRATVQQNCFLALSSLGEAERIIRIVGNAKFQTTLSFRTFQEFFDAYTGDRVCLITRLLEVASDMYVKRACIKSIGTNHITELAPLVLPYLELEFADQHIQMDAIRTMGILRYKPAGGVIANLATSLKWEVRSVVAWALAFIDINFYFDVILSLLFDARWGVRYRAAQALVDYQDCEAVVAFIKEKNDRYALDIYLYMLHQKKLYKSEVVE